MISYTPEQIDILLNCFFRDHRRHMPWKQIAERMGPDVEAGPLERLLWGIITGYGGNTEDGPRRAYAATATRERRTGWTWYARETAAMQAALTGAGRKRTPPCDIAYVAAVLQRDESEVQAKWNEMNADPLGRDGGFGFNRDSTSGTPASSKGTT